MILGVDVSNDGVCLADQYQELYALPTVNVCVIIVCYF